MHSQNVCIPPRNCEYIYNFTKYIFILQKILKKTTQKHLVVQAVFNTDSNNNIKCFCEKFCIRSWDGRKNNISMLLWFPKKLCSVAKVSWRNAKVERKSKHWNRIFAPISYFFFHHVLLRALKNQDIQQGKKGSF